MFAPNDDVVLGPAIAPVCVPDPRRVNMHDCPSLVLEPLVLQRLRVTPSHVRMRTSVRSAMVLALGADQVNLLRVYEHDPRPVIEPWGLGRNSSLRARLHVLRSVD